ncbi:VrrA/YqfQ family protein [Fictibacillus phosphorivorans]|uniref:VrrA/YqfQ family protein n=1 Tax=Fictibacillus phosphorivorans TaxID=1221500 RepID=UPI001884917B|nr:VrrA/YqfQ family protein [Fictibacillus phosphorivorans]
MQPFYRYPNQPQHPMQPFQVNPYLQNMNGMNGMPRQMGSVDRFLGTIGSGGSITGGTSVFTMLNNVQKVLKVAETMGPMIKQYGPAMRNLPSIMTALKDFQSGSSSKAEKDTEADTSEKPENTDQATETIEKSEPKKTVVKKNEKKEKKKTETEEKVVVAGPKSTTTSSQPEPIPMIKKTPAATKAVPSAPKTNVPKGYHLSGPKLYV